MAWIKNRGSVLYLFDRVLKTKKGGGAYWGTYKESLKVQNLTREEKSQIIADYERKKALEGRGIHTTDNSGKRWAEFMQQYKKDTKKAELTWVKEDIVVRHFERIINPAAASDVGDEQADLYCKTRLFDEKRRGSTVRSEARYLSGIFNRAVKWGYAKSNPFFKMKVVDPREPKTKVKVMWTTEEIQKIFGKMLEVYGELSHLMVNVHFYQGLRTHELTAVQKEHFRFSRGKMFILGKGRKEAEVDIHPEVLPLLKKAIKPGEKGLLFAYPDGRRVPDRTYQNRFKKVVTDLVIAGEISSLGVPHSLRHNIVSHMLASGVDLASARDHARHANISTTNTYTHAIKKGDPAIGRFKMAAGQNGVGLDTTMDTSNAVGFKLPSGR